MSYTDLPAINASLNGLATVLMLAGFIAIKQKNIGLHKALMIGAGVASAVFLGCYLVYHFNVGSVKFKGEGIVRYVYFAILISHVILAMAIAVLVPKTFWRAFKKDIEGHKRIARITFPIWLYVSITGVVIYLMLYKWFPG
jgi:putative membrane protein